MGEDRDGLEDRRRERAKECTSLRDAIDDGGERNEDGEMKLGFEREMECVVYMGGIGPLWFLIKR